MWMDRGFGSRHHFEKKTSHQNVSFVRYVVMQPLSVARCNRLSSGCSYVFCGRQSTWRSDIVQARFSAPHGHLIEGVDLVPLTADEDVTPRTKVGVSKLRPVTTFERAIHNGSRSISPWEEFGVEGSKPFVSLRDPCSKVRRPPVSHCDPWWKVQILFKCLSKVQRLFHDSKVRKFRYHSSVFEGSKI